ncbi:MAG: M24 family metallopeptidase [Candidatus Pacebacteria bacterium]|nr:M24 family metallopeptidase [Candidatus Paceibacterota bacterium]
MAIPIKTKKEIQAMCEGGEKLSRVLKKVLENVIPGITLIELDRLAEKLIKKQGGEPNFKMVSGYHWATCLNINQGVVHGIPNDYRLRVDDLLSIDLGMLYRSFHTDMAKTVLVQTQPQSDDPGSSDGFDPGPLSQSKSKSNYKQRFLKAGEEALKKAIQAVKAGNHIGHISQAMGTELARNNLRPVKILTGHGIGRKLHQPPTIPCFLKGEIKKTLLLEPGMTLAIEAIYVEKEPDLRVENDGWTIVTRDGGLAGLFEKTVLVREKGVQILTDW